MTTGPVQRGLQIRLVAGAILLAGARSLCAEQTSLPRVDQVARASTRPAGAPRYSDVSVRFFSIRKDVPAERMIEAGKAFHITRADWSYITDPQFIRQVREMGWAFQASTNAITENAAFARRHRDGTPILDHFNKPGRFMADPNNRAYRDWYVEQVKQWIQLGVYAFQRDEPSGLGGPGRRWEPDEADDFYRDVHVRIAALVPDRKIVWSCNLAWNVGRFPQPDEAADKYTRHFDYGMSEVGPRALKPDMVWQRVRQAQTLGKALVYTGGDGAASTAQFRRAIAASYANGVPFIVPWDQFAGLKEPRVFLEPKAVADLYAFVRAAAPWIEGHEDAAAVGKGLKDPRWADGRPLLLDTRSALCAFVRAKPDDPDAPVAIHLIDWSDHPASTTLRLHRPSFTAGTTLEVALLSPAPYDKQKHALAWEGANQLRRKGELFGPQQAPAYAPLLLRSALQTTVEGATVSITVPPLSPWGILLVSRSR